MDITKPQIQKLIEEMHTCVQRKLHSMNENDANNDTIIRQNRLLLAVCREPKLEPRRYAEKLNEAYGSEMRGWDVIRIFRSMYLSNQEKRADLISWAGEMADLFGQVLETRDQKLFALFKKKRNESIETSEGGKYRVQERIGALMLYARFPELDIHGDTDAVMGLGNVYAKYLLYDISDVLADYCGAVAYIKRVDNKKLSIEQEKRRIDQLEKELERTNMMLQELQDEFNQRLEESRVDEMAEFFAKLNSEKYGCILDELLQIRKGVNELKRSHFEIPVEISGLLILTQKLTQFIRDSHINPIMKPKEEKLVTFADIENCDYEGTPFGEKTEQKYVVVVSPGWTYEDKDMQISRPKVKEIEKC